MPWQQMVADVAGEYDRRTGRPHYRECILTIPRQSGKTTLVLAFEVHRALAWSNRPQKVAYTAQTGWDARKKLIDDQAPLLMASPLREAVRQVLRGAGNEGVIFHNGSRIDVLASTEAAGHGRTLDLAVLDEVFADTDTRREQAILPSMATRRDAQMLVVSTAGTDSSLYLRQKVNAGRAAVDRGDDAGICYFEWSCPDDADVYDPTVWPSFMPALGHTIDAAVVQHAAATMPQGEFRRAFGNQWTSSDERVIPLAAWEAVCSPSAAPSGRVVLAIDVTPDRSAAALVAAGAGVIEVVDHRPGTGWLVERTAEVAHRQRAVVAVPDGPAKGFAPELERQGVKVEHLTNDEMAQAAGRFYDDVAEARIKVRTHPGLDAAVAGATKAPSGDGWRWGRKNTLVDVSPLVAGTAAWWQALHAPTGGGLFLAVT